MTVRPRMLGVIITKRPSPLGWMTGGGVKKGFVDGKTDELGYGIVEDPTHVHDFNATIMHLLGIDHERLTFKYQGRPYRLTDIGGVVADEIIA